MKNFIIKLLVTTVSVIFSVYILEPHVKLDGGFPEALILALILGFLNAVLKPILVLLTLPITIFTMGIFYLFLNAFIIYIADSVDDHFHVNGFGWALLFSLIVSIISSIIETVLKRDKILDNETNKDQEI